MVLGLAPNFDSIVYLLCSFGQVTQPLWASLSSSQMGIMLSSGGFPSLIHSTVSDEYPSQASVPHHCRGLHSDIGGSVLSRGCAWLGRNYYF